MTGVLGTDVEDWLHHLDLEAAPEISTWGHLNSRVEREFHHLLDISDEGAITATCFFVGWIIKTYQHLVFEANRQATRSQPMDVPINWFTDKHRKSS